MKIGKSILNSLRNSVGTEFWSEMGRPGSHAVGNKVTIKIWNSARNSLFNSVVRSVSISVVNPISDSVKNR